MLHREDLQRPRFLGNLGGDHEHVPKLRRDDRLGLSFPTRGLKTLDLGRESIPHLKVFLSQGQDVTRRLLNQINGRSRSPEVTDYSISEQRTRKHTNMERAVPRRGKLWCWSGHSIPCLVHVFVVVCLNLWGGNLRRSK